MDCTEGPIKKRKLEDGVSSSTENHVANGDSCRGASVATPSRAQPHLQFNQSMFERLRIITKDCRKKFQPTPKPNGTKLPLAKGKGSEESAERNESTSASANSSDFVISSAGSSPAHSPKPMDFEFLSTPPRPSKSKAADFEASDTHAQSSKTKLTNFEVLGTPPRASAGKTSAKNGTVDPNPTHYNDADDCNKMLGRLRERFEELLPKRTLPNGVYTDTRTFDQDTTAEIEVLEERGQSDLAPSSSAKTGDSINGEINAGKEATQISSKQQSSLASSDAAAVRTNTDIGSSGFSENAEDLRKMVKKMIEDKMNQMQRSVGHGNVEKIALLEQENTALKNYANKLEASLKKLTSEAKKERTTRAVQTQDPNWLSNMRPKTSAQTPSQNSVAVTQASSMRLALDTTPTPRLTSTVAPLPGHTVPSRLENTLVSFNPVGQRPPSTQMGPLRPRIPSTPNMSQQAGIKFVTRYEAPSAGRLVSGQSAGLRASTVSVVPRFNGATTAQPVMRMQGSVTAGAPRSIAPPSSRPLPTVTVHPQTAPSVSSPSAYGYSAPNALNNGQLRPRFTMASPVRPQRLTHPQNVPQQISPGPRTPVFPRSPLQAALSPQRVMQQPIGMEQQKAHLPRPQSAPVRASPPIPIQTVNQRTVPHHNAVAHYQQVPTQTPRQITPSQPSPNYGTTAIRGSQPSTTGIPPRPSPVTRGSPATHPPKELPPKPSVSIDVVASGIVLSWNMVLEDRHPHIMNYQLFALQDGGTVENANQWKKIGVVKALPLPMACTLTQFLPGNKYHFAVRATDDTGRLGPFSDPCTITLK